MLIHKAYKFRIYPNKKQRRKVARIHEKIVNARTDYLHKISTEIIKNHDVMVSKIYKYQIC